MLLLSDESAGQGYQTLPERWCCMASTTRLRFDRDKQTVVARQWACGSIAVVVAVSLLLASCTSTASQTTQNQATEPGESEVRTLSSISTLRNLFNHDAGTVRLVLLLSPT